MASMMDEMQKTLARRRAKVDRSSEEPDSDRPDGGEGRRQEIEKSCSPGKPFSQPGSQAGSESPKPGMSETGEPGAGGARRYQPVNTPALLTSPSDD